MIILVPAIFIAIGLGFIAWGLYVHRLGKRIHTWPTTTAVITSAGVSERARMSGDDPMSDASYSHHVNYIYSVNGYTFQGNRIAVGLQRMSMTGSGAMSQISRYAKGMKVKVYYDPGNPRFAVLQTGAQNAMTLILWGAGIIAFFSCGLGFVLYVR